MALLVCSLEEAVESRRASTSKPDILQIARWRWGCSRLRWNTIGLLRQIWKWCDGCEGRWLEEVDAVDLVFDA